MSEIQAQRETLEINDNWYFAHMRSDSVSQDDFFSDLTDLVNVDLPHIWASDYSGRSIYFRTVRMDRSRMGRNVFIEFDEVAAHAELFVNSISVGKHDDACAAFQCRFDISNVIHGGENELAIVMDNTSWHVPDEGENVCCGIRSDVRIIIEA